MEDNVDKTDSGKHRTPKSLLNAVKAKKSAEKNLKRLKKSGQQIAFPYYASNILEEMKRLAFTDPAIEAMKQDCRTVDTLNAFVEEQERYQRIIEAASKPLYYDSVINDITKQLAYTNHAKEAMRQFHHTFHTSDILSIIDKQEKYRIQIIEALKPSFAMHKRTMLEIAVEAQQNTLKSLTASLQDYKPFIDVLNENLIIESERFAREQIAQIAEDYIWDENSNKNIFYQDDKKKYLESIPKPIRWLLKMIVEAIIIFYLTGFLMMATKDTKYRPEAIFRQLVHKRKNVIKQINKGLIMDFSQPFVNNEYLSVHIRPKRRSMVVATLSYPCEVRIVEFKKKKRWVLIEWEGLNGESHQGWCLGRYIYRKKI